MSETLISNGSWSWTNNVFIERSGKKIKFTCRRSANSPFPVSRNHGSRNASTTWFLIIRTTRWVRTNLKWRPQKWVARVMTRIRGKLKNMLGKIRTYLLTQMPWNISVLLMYAVVSHNSGPHKYHGKLIGLAGPSSWCLSNTFLFGQRRLGNFNFHRNVFSG